MITSVSDAEESLCRMGEDEQNHLNSANSEGDLDEDNDEDDDDQGEDEDDGGEP